MYAGWALRTVRVSLCLCVATRADVPERGMNAVSRYVPPEQRHSMEVTAMKRQQKLSGALPVLLNSPGFPSGQLSWTWKQVENEPQHIQQVETETLSKLQGGVASKTSKRST